VSRTPVPGRRRFSAAWGLRSRLLVWNCVLVFLPVAALLFLDTHERAMLADQERRMAEIGRLLAASLAAGGGLEASDIERTLLALERGTGARIRVLDVSGRVLADSSVLGPVASAEAAVATARDGPGASWLYRIGAAPIRLWRAWRGSTGAAPRYPPADVYAAGGPLLGPEVRAALAGRYGAATRRSAGGQRSLTLYSALPIYDDDGAGVVGAVLVSQSTWRILRALQVLRLEIAQVLAASLLAAAALSLLLSRTIAHPLRRLRDEAERMLDRSGRLRGRFTALGRSDEIGALARSLEALRARLEERVGAMERFAVELDHEFKNPLASVRNAAELVVASEDPLERRRLAGWIERDVARMQHILCGVREIGRRDAGRAEDRRERIDLASLARGVAEACERRRGVRVHVTGPAQDVWVEACPEGLCQILENLIDNACDFGGGAEVVVELGIHRGEARLRVLDRGPGIPEADLDRVFDRFYSRRTGSGPATQGHHAGLGLPIARAIASDGGGSIRAFNRGDGGACFEVRWPSAGGSSEEDGTPVPPQRRGGASRRRSGTATSRARGLLAKHDPGKDQKREYQPQT